jgi:hypothetical protein
MAHFDVSKLEPIQIDTDTKYIFESDDGKVTVLLRAPCRLFVPAHTLSLQENDDLDSELARVNASGQSLCLKMRTFLDHIVWMFTASSLIYANPVDALVELRRRFSGANGYFRPFAVGSMKRMDAGEVWRFRTFLQVSREMYEQSGPGGTQLLLQQQPDGAHAVRADTHIVGGLSLIDFCAMKPDIKIEHFDSSAKLQRQKIEKEKKARELKVATAVIAGKVSAAMVMSLQSKRIFPSARMANACRLVISQLTGAKIPSVGKTRAETLRKLQTLDVSLPKLLKIFLDEQTQTCHTEDDALLRGARTYIGVAFDMKKQVLRAAVCFIRQTRIHTHALGVPGFFVCTHRTVVVC